jgi:NADH:ubiquinone oxidoreductase subunit 2 (subunit N)
MNWNGEMMYRIFVNRALSTVIFVYAFLAAYQGGHAFRWLNGNGILWCGNVVSDPFRILVRVIGPIAAICALTLGIRCFKARRWSLSVMAVLLVFALTTAALARQAWILERDYGVDGLRNAFWWLPRF